jgi:hypothetical protein
MAKFAVIINAVGVAAAQDLFDIVVGGHGAYLHELYLDQKTLTSGRLGVTVTKGYGTVGSGGSAVTPVAIDQSTGATIQTTTRINDTSGASSGTPVVYRSMTWNLVAGLLWLPTPEDRLLIEASQRLVIKLIDAPASSMTVTGTLILDE